MKRQAIMGAAGLLLMAVPAAAVPEYDKVLERAAGEIVAEKIGSLEDTLRGTFGRNNDPVFSVAVVGTGANSGKQAGKVWIDGLAPAVDPLRHDVADRTLSTGTVFR